MNRSIIRILLFTGFVTLSYLSYAQRNITSYVDSLINVYNSYKLTMPERDFLSLLNCAISSDSVENSAKVRYQYLANNISKNMVGEKAANFEFLNKENIKKNLYDSDNEVTILIFGSAGCSHCRALKKALQREPLFKQLSEHSQIKIIYVSTEKSRAIWESDFLPSYIESAFDINHYISDLSYDFSLGGTPLFYLRRLPVIYILDREKIVLAREVSFEYTKNFLTEKFAN